MSVRCISLMIVSILSGSPFYAFSTPIDKGISQGPELPTEFKEDTSASVQQDIEKNRKRLLFTFSKRKELIKSHVEKAMKLTETAYNKTTRPDFKFKLSLKLAKLYVDYAQSLMLLSEAAYEQALEKRKKTSRKGPPPQPPTHNRAKGYESKAIGVLKKALKNKSQSNLDEPLFFLGLVYVNRGELETAKSHFVRLLRKFPKSPYRYQAKLLLAESYYEGGQYRSAYDLYQELIKKKPGDPYTKYKKAWTLFNLRQFKRAIQLFVSLYQASLSAPKTSRLYEIGNQIVDDLVVIYVDSKRVSEAVRFFDGLSSKTLAVKQLRKLSQIMIENGAYVEARNVCLHILNRYGGSPLIPKVLLIYVDALKDYVHDARQYHESITVFLTRELRRFFNSQKVAKNRALFLGYQEIESFVVKQAKALHAKAQKLKQSQKNKKIKKQILLDQSNVLFRMALKYYELYGDLFFTWKYTKHRIEMSFFRAELYYFHAQYLKAAEAYVRVIRLRKWAKNKQEKSWVSQSLYGAVSAYDHILHQAQKEQPRATAHKKSLPPMVLKFLKIANYYLKTLPTHPSYAEVSYRAGRLFYDHGHYGKATPYFWRTIQKKPNSQEAAFSAHLILDAYSVLKNFGKIVQSAKQLLLIPEIRAKRKLAKSIREVLNKTEFKLVESYEKGQDYEKAAQAYLALSQKSSKELGEKALYNAGINFEKAENWPAAIKIFRQLIVKYPKSTFRKHALLTIADYSQKLGRFDESQRLYTRFLGEFPRSTAGYKDILYQVAYVAWHLKNYSKAYAYFTRYLNQYAKATDREQVIRYLCSSAANTGLSAIQQVKKRVVPKAKESKTKTHCKFEEARFIFRRDQVTAIRILRPIRTAFKTHIGTDDRDMFSPYFDQNVLSIARRYRAKRLATVPVSESGALLKQKISLMESLEKVIQEIESYGIVSSLFLGLKTLAEISTDLSQDILRAKLPPGLNESQKIVYKNQLKKIAEDFEKKGKKGLVVLVSQTGELQWLPDGLSVVWRQLNTVMNKTINIPQWIRTIQVMPFYLPLKQGKAKRPQSFFPVVLLDPFSVAHVASKVPNLSGLQPQDKAYFDMLVLLGREDLQGAWGRMMPLLSKNPDDPWLLNALAYLKLKEGKAGDLGSRKRGEAWLMLEQALKAGGQPFKKITSLNKALIRVSEKRVYEAQSRLHSLSDHFYATTISGFIALKSYNFSWARSLFYPIRNETLEQGEAPFHQVGLALAKWAAEDIEGALSDLLPLERSGQIQTSVLPILAALFLNKNPPMTREAQKRLSVYSTLPDRNRERRAWANHLLGGSRRSK